ncbi:hypothetical protein K488DRAFT_36128, partial [Vararia minispora EC-137]
NAHVAAGRLPDEVYESTLSPLRLCLRKVLVGCVEWESEVLGGWQLRHPWLDKYFLATSMLGTHTFFMVFLPVFFYFGDDSTGRGLAYVAAFGVYSTSFLKDLVCSPRPYAPPVTRLTIGSHHLEYGFPSSHTANCTSMALFLMARLYPLWTSGTLSTLGYALTGVLLLLYVFTIIGGRLYLGMHGFVDCTAGFIVGIAMWLVQWAYMPPLEQWLTTAGWIAPLTVTAICLLMVNQHPQPVDDCPCFEDAIAFMSVVLGVLLSLWTAKKVPVLDASNFGTLQPGSSFDSPTAVATFVAFSLLKVVTGILVILGWRLAAKPTAQTILPPLFRFLARAVPFQLPNRRHYTPATEYANHPPHNLQPIPSMIDLSLSVTTEGGEAGIASALGGRRGAGEVKRRGAVLPVPEKQVEFKLSHEDQREAIKHYDADVLTKVVVYAGIAIIASLLSPAAFEALGWGV